MAYWDAQIWASAKMNQVPVVFSEDFGEGVIIEGVRFVNPFSSNFNIEVWLPGSRTT
jgi:predicted nucleic acid-binding protein